MNTTDATVSTVVDRQFAENLPLNGRSFQTLIQLTPGVVLTANNGYDTGQFSVNGQRASSNYWMVDGVSANIGMSATAQLRKRAGGCAWLDQASWEVRTAWSRLTPCRSFASRLRPLRPSLAGHRVAQISIVTRSGTNQFHGTAFDYLRNDVLDANDWFNGYTNNPPLPKAKERQNDFGGTLSGPILKNKTFFFFSYEGLRLRLPQTALTLCPRREFHARHHILTANASPGVAAVLERLSAAKPSSPEILCDPKLIPSVRPPDVRVAAFNASFSNPATLDAYSLRIDHKLSDKLNVFGRYNYSPSELTQRGVGAGAKQRRRRSESPPKLELWE